MEADDSSIIAKVLDGDTEQFGEIVRRYQVGLYRYATSMVGDHDVAADMVQDAFVRAYTNLASCRDRERFRLWLSRRRPGERRAWRERSSPGLGSCHRAGMTRHSPP